MHAKRSISFSSYSMHYISGLDSSKYKYGFNGKEKDNETNVEGGDYDYGARIYDSRVGRFLSFDPLFERYPSLTLYQFASNMPISCIDLDGLEAKASFYGAGVHWETDGTYTQAHMVQFKKEAERDVTWSNANKAYKGLTGKELVTVLEDLTSSEGSIEYLSVFSHAAPAFIILDNGQFGRQTLGNKDYSDYVKTPLDDVFNNPKIKFEPNALVVFGGCNTGRQKSFDRKTPIVSVAESITRKYGIATIGADGYTSPSGKDGVRKADFQYYLFYNDENGDFQKTGLGQELNDEAIEKAKAIVNDVANKIKEKSKPKEESPTETDSTGG